MVGILRGSLLGSVPLPAPTGTGPAGVTLATGGGLVFGTSGGNTWRGPVRALTSTGVSSRGTIFSLPSPTAMRSATFDEPSAGAGTTLVGLLSALMIGGSLLRGE